MIFLDTVKVRRIDFYKIFIIVKIGHVGSGLVEAGPEHLVLALFPDLLLKVIARSVVILIEILKVFGDLVGLGLGQPPISIEDHLELVEFLPEVIVPLLELLDQLDLMLK